MHLKNGRSTESGAYMQKETTSRMMVAIRTKFVFGLITVPIQDIMDGFRY
jgi:hypothetical protein